MGRLLPKNLKVARSGRLLPITYPGFGGGLNAVDNDISMPADHQVQLDNFKRTASKGQKLRYGSQWFADVKSQVNGDIVDMEYFASTIIGVTDQGEIAAIDDAGTVTKIWNTAIAALLPGTPAGWSTGLDSIDFVPFKSQLIVHNGTDKPLAISSSHIVTYLADAGSGSNVNVPIGKYGCVVSNYHCVAGLPSNPTLIYVSAIGTSGTFPGDPPPNDSISIDVGAYAPSGAPEIRGIAGFRSNLIVFFQGQSLVVKLGVYNDVGVHVPEFPDTLPEVGLLGHRCVIPYGTDLSFAGLTSVNSARRDLYLSGQLNSDSLSSIIEPLYRSHIGTLTNNEMLKSCFVVNDKLNYDILIFLPGGNVFTYSVNEKLHYKSWSTFSGLNWRCGCTSFLGRSFFASGSRIYQGGNGVFPDEDFAADKLLDRQSSWAPVTSYNIGDLIFDTADENTYICTVANFSGSVSFTQDRADQIASPKWALYDGVAIAFILEMPWLSGHDKMQLVNAKYTSIASKGTAEFTLQLYVDNLYKDQDGFIIYDPAISMDFIGNDAPGFGFDAGPYGGGRRSQDPRLYSTPVKFKTVKPVFTGSTKKPLELINLSFLYLKSRTAHRR